MVDDVWRPDPYASYAATGLVVVLITYFSIVLGELVPKRLGQSNPETVARLVAKPINLLAIATKPFVRLLSGSAKGLLRLMGVKESTGSSVTEAEIHAVLAEGTSAGVIESHEHTMVRTFSCSMTANWVRWYGTAGQLSFV